MRPPPTAAPPIAPRAAPAAVPPHPSSSCHCGAPPPRSAALGAALQTNTALTALKLDANDLECDSTCSQSVGWTVTIPGGTELLSGS